MARKKIKKNVQDNPIAMQAKHRHDYISRLKFVSDQFFGPGWFEKIPKTDIDLIYENRYPPIIIKPARGQRLNQERWKYYYKGVGLLLDDPIATINGGQLPRRVMLSEGLCLLHFIELMTIDRFPGSELLREAFKPTILSSQGHYYKELADYMENGKELFFTDSLVYRTNAGMYSLKNKYMPLLDEQQPDINHFEGKLYVLINGASGSMASVVASLVKGNKRAIFIGEESGGTMEGNTSHQSARLVLPNTKIRVAIPLVKTTNAVHFTKGRGVMPDHPVTPQIHDILKGIDTELNFTLGLISSKR